MKKITGKLEHTKSFKAETVRITWGRFILQNQVDKGVEFH